MPTSKCPECKMILTPTEMKSGSCPMCDAELGAAKSEARTYTSNSRVQANADRVSAIGYCELSGKQGEKVQTRYLAAATFSPLGLLMPLIMILTRKQICVEVRCSEESYRKAKSVSRKPLLMLLAWLLLGGPLMIVAVAGLGKMAPVLAGIFAAAWFLCPFALIVWMGMFRRKSLDGLLSESLNSQLRKELKGRRWGLSTVFTVHKKAPRGLNVVRASAL